MGRLRSSIPRHSTELCVSEYKNQRGEKVRKKVKYIVQDREPWTYYSTTDKRQHTVPGMYWKVHISIDLHHSYRGYIRAKSILMKYGMRHFKILKPLNSAMMASLGQQGKSIVVYLRFNPELSQSDFDKIFKKIDNILMEAKVKPGVVAIGDRKLSGYCSYRNDKSPGGTYVPTFIAVKLGQRLGTSMHNPFQNFNRTADYHCSLEKIIIPFIRNMVAPSPDLVFKEAITSCVNRLENELKLGSSRPIFFYFKDRFASHYWLRPKTIMG